MACLHRAWFGFALALPLCAWGAAPSAQAQTTWTVDDNGGQDFVHIQDAVDAAQPGDVIWVHAGAYAAFVIDGKPLVVRTVGTPVEVAGMVVVRNTPAGSQVEIDGLAIGATHMVDGEPAIRLEDNPGSVRLIDCELSGIDGGCGYCGYPGYPGCGPFTERALSVRNSLETILLRCSFVGGRAAHSYAYYYGYYCPERTGADAVTVSDSIVSFFECSAQGGYGSNGAWEECSYGGDGGHGVLVGPNSTFFADRSTFTGSPGGTPGCDGVFPFQCCGSSGRFGASVELDATSSGTWKDTTFATPPAGAGTPLPEVFMSPFCFGTYEECPCGNAGVGVAGCENSAGTGGALLRATGWPSVGNDTVTLVVSGLNPNANPTGLFFQGTLRQNNGFGTVLNDGLLCAAGTIVRLKGKTSINGASVYGFNSSDNDAPISVRGQVPLGGGTRTYQFWYRNQPAMFCPPAQFNMSNGVEIVWVP